MPRKIIAKFYPAPVCDEAKEFADESLIPEVSVLAPAEEPRENAPLDVQFMLRVENGGPGGSWQMPITRQVAVLMADMDKCGCGAPADATGYCDDCFGG